MNDIENKIKGAYKESKNIYDNLLTKSRLKTMEIMYKINIKSNVLELSIIS
ncbi:hypothetical protein [Clostridium weizhouense]|uniref:Transcriptional regulator n=1 Tax=Clostridium weizhouense TaxID=2859781 RepID=A0ABS7AQP7_9CLOT|nr:hypothetical protein [Clostridium weizhouense]MBW6410991.1 hypothetical protein [Clostridium weizhouense]